MNTFPPIFHLLICVANLRINYIFSIFFCALTGDNRMKNDWSRGGGMNLRRMRRPEDPSSHAGLMMDVAVRQIF